MADTTGTGDKLAISLNIDVVPNLTEAYAKSYRIHIRPISTMGDNNFQRLIKLLPVAPYK